MVNIREKLSQSNVNFYFFNKSEKNKKEYLYHIYYRGVRYKLFETEEGLFFLDSNNERTHLLDKNDEFSVGLLITLIDFIKDK